MSEAAEMVEVIEGMFGRVSDELISAWHRGLCDGLEIAALLVEKMMSHTSDQPVLAALIAAIRDAEMRVQLDGVAHESGAA